MELQLSHRGNVMRTVETGQLDQLEHCKAVLGEEVGGSPNQKPVPTTSLYRYDAAHPVPGSYWTPINGSLTDDWQRIA